MKYLIVTLMVAVILAMVAIGVTSLNQIETTDVPELAKKYQQWAIEENNNDESK